MGMTLLSVCSTRSKKSTRQVQSVQKAECTQVYSAMTSDVLGPRTSTSDVSCSRTSTPDVSCFRTSTPDVSCSRTSTPDVSCSRTSTSDVSCSRTGTPDAPCTMLHSIKRDGDRKKSIPKYHQARMSILKMIHPEHTFDTPPERS